MEQVKLRMLAYQTKSYNVKGRAEELMEPILLYIPTFCEGSRHLTRHSYSIPYSVDFFSNYKVLIHHYP